MRITSLLRRNEAGEAVEEPRQHQRCLSCDADLEGSKSYERFRVCHSCGFHFHLSARERIATLLDAGSFHEDDRGVTAIDPLSFQDRHSYRSRVINAQRRTGMTEAALTGTGTVFGRELVIAILDFSFLGGSIGVVVGERLARAFEKATARRVPLVTVCSSSGTRMQEGLLALMQIPRVAVAAQKHHMAHLAHISIAGDPTTGFAYAGLMSMADIILAEPNALMGFAALRVVEEAQGSALPEHAHTAESHMAHGLIDSVVDRPRLRDSIAGLLDLLENEYQIRPGRSGETRQTPHAHGNAWQTVELSRHQSRPTARDFIGRMTTAFFEIHGDRIGGDDKAIVAGLATIGGESVVIVGQQRPEGSNGHAAWIGPGGFRKARRAMKLAAKFQIPLVTLIDTAGANPGLESEEAGLGEAMSACITTMLEIPVPTVAVVIGEGNSEGAVSMAVADRVLMLENAVYEVIRPEDAAKILYQEVTRAEEVAERLRLTAHDCVRLGVVDGVVPEPGEGAHTDHAEAALLLRRSLLRTVGDIQRARPKRRLERRLARYREIGSTRSWLRGTVERRMAHLTDRVGGMIDRYRNRSSVMRRRVDFGDDTDFLV
ncbi:MAG: carboxyl transferase domain-containing protein [Tepidiformaceae bacterium]